MRTLEAALDRPSVLDRREDPSWTRTRRHVLERDNYTCQYCGLRPERARTEPGRWTRARATLHVDHIFPRRLGGTDHLWNLVTACERCNLRKASTYYDFAHAHQIEVCRRQAAHDDDLYIFWEWYREAERIDNEDWVIEQEQRAEMGH